MGMPTVAHTRREGHVAYGAVHRICFRDEHFEPRIAREVRRVGEFVSFRENIFDSGIGGVGGCDGEYLVELLLRHTKVPADGHVSA